MRSLRNLCLAYAHAAGNPRAAIMLKDQYQTANNLTDKLAALQTMVNSQTPAKSDMEVDALKKCGNVLFADGLLDGNPAGMNGLRINERILFGDKLFRRQ